MTGVVRGHTGRSPSGSTPPPPSAAGTIEVLAVAARCAESALNSFQGQEPAAEGGLQNQISRRLEKVRLLDGMDSLGPGNSHTLKMPLVLQFAAHNRSNHAC